MRVRRRPHPLSDWDDIVDTTTDGIISIASGSAVALVVPQLVKIALPESKELASGVGIVTGLLTTFIVSKALSPPPKGKAATGIKPHTDKLYDTFNRKADEKIDEIRERNNKSRNMVGNILAGVATGIATMYVANALPKRKVYKYGRSSK